MDDSGLVPKARTKTAVLIDLDGTLMDTAPDLAAASNLMRHAFGLPNLPVSRIAAFIGKGAEVLVHRAWTDDLDGRLDPGLFERARASFYQHYHRINGTEAIVFEGVPEALGLLRAGGLKLSCVTNKPKEFTSPLLERLGLTHWFDVIVAGDEVADPKPHPALLLEACRRLDVDPSDAWMIGDSVNDVLAAEAAGMSVVLVETGYNEGTPLNTLRDHSGLERITPTLIDAARYIVHLSQRNTQ